jgi:hypothetical protein
VWQQIDGLIGFDEFSRIGVFELLNQYFGSVVVSSR